MLGITGLACMEVLIKVGMAFEGMQLVAYIECSLMRRFGIPHIKGIANIEKIFQKLNLSFNGLHSYQNNLLLDKETMVSGKTMMRTSDSQEPEVQYVSKDR